MTHSACRPQTKHGCIIMASGTSTRFGTNKLIAELGGVPLIQHVLRATDGLYARRVVVTRHPDVARLCDMRGVEVVLHDEPLRNDTVRLGFGARRALPCSFPHGRSTSCDRFRPARAAAWSPRRTRSACAPSRFPANGSSSTWTPPMTCKPFKRISKTESNRSRTERRRPRNRRSTGRLLRLRFIC